VRPREGCEVLLSHPWKDSAVLAAGEFGKGRTLALATNTSWRWALGSNAPESYVRFWRNVVRYLGGSDDSQKVSMAFDSAEYSAGQEFDIRLRVRDRRERMQVRLTLTDPAGNKAHLPLERLSEGEWRAHGRFALPGNYRFQAASADAGASIAPVTKVLNVADESAEEYAELGVDDAVLTEMAAASGGEYLVENAFSAEALSKRIKDNSRRPADGQLALWDSGWLLALLVFSLVGEWIYRKKRGLR
jgi:hypothetical protein